MAHEQMSILLTTTDLSKSNTYFESIGLFVNVIKGSNNEHLHNKNVLQNFEVKFSAFMHDYFSLESDVLLIKQSSVTGYGINERG